MQRPLATVVIGGPIGVTLLTLVVLSTLYARFHGPVAGRYEDRAEPQLAEAAE